MEADDDDGGVHEAVEGPWGWGGSSVSAGSGGDGAVGTLRGRPRLVLLPLCNVHLLGLFLVIASVTLGGLIVLGPYTADTFRTYNTLVGELMPCSSIEPPSADQSAQLGTVWEGLCGVNAGCAAGQMDFSQCCRLCVSKPACAFFFSTDSDCTIFGLGNEQVCRLF